MVVPCLAARYLGVLSFSRAVPATRLAEIPLPNLPAASGVEFVGASASLVSDDAPCRYLRDAATRAPVAALALFASTAFETGRMPKARPPELERMGAVVAPSGAAGR